MGLAPQVVALAPSTPPTSPERRAFKGFPGEGCDLAAPGPGWHSPCITLRHHRPGVIMGATQKHCIFCEIVHGAGEASICYEDAESIAFMDIQPVNPGHVLIVPREHYESLNDMSPKVAMHLFEVALKLGPIVRGVSDSDDLNIVVNSGEAAGQDVFHYHVHLIPRRNTDGFDVPLPFAGSEMPDRTLLDAMAARIIAELRDPVRRSGSSRSVATA